MRSLPILFSILISTIILSVSVISVKSISGKYNRPVNVSYQHLSKPLQKQIDCLAENIYYEAGYESKDGQIAVALVTLNRLSTGFYGKDICGVVKQKANGVCQFSWVCQTKSLTNTSKVVYNDIKQLAVYVVMNYDVINDVTKGATFYHADYVNPQWGLPKTIKIGRHIFYKNERDVANINKDFKL